MRKGNKEISFSGSIRHGHCPGTGSSSGIVKVRIDNFDRTVLGYRKEELTRFSFLMVIVPIIGANFVEIMTTKAGAVDVVLLPLIIAFVTAFVSGYVACRWMISIVRKG